jgi:hypothetical protein
MHRIESIDPRPTPADAWARTAAHAAPRPADTPLGRPPAPLHARIGRARAWPLVDRPAPRTDRSPQ